MIETREARYFLAVADELHFGRAAERLHMSQPPLSQAIKALEARLGVQLLTRTTRAVALTSAGEVLREHARRLVHLADEAESAAREAAGGQVGRLRIGAVTSAFFDPLPAMLERFRLARPRVEVTLHELDTHDAARALLDHAVDVAVVRRLTTPATMERKVLRRHDFVLAVPADRTHLHDGLDLAAAAREPWIWLPREISPDYHDQVVACCRRAGFAPTVTNTAGSIVSQLAMVACGIGVALVPEGSAELPVAGSERVRLSTLRDPTSIELAATWLRGNGNPSVAAFVATSTSADSLP